MEELVKVNYSNQETRTQMPDKDEACLLHSFTLKYENWKHFNKLSKITKLRNGLAAASQTRFTDKVWILMYPFGVTTTTYSSNYTASRLSSTLLDLAETELW